MALPTKNAGTGVVRQGAGLVVVAALIVWGLYLAGMFSAPPAPEMAKAPVARPQEESPVAQATPDPESEPATSDQSPGPVQALAAPTFDVVRVEADGGTIIAGTAAPGSMVAILLDEVEQDRVQAGSDGKFASLLTLPIAQTPRVLTLQAQLGDRSAGSEDQIILAPSPRPEPVAQADAVAEVPTQMAQAEDAQPQSLAETAPTSEAPKAGADPAAESVQTAPKAGAAVAASDPDTGDDVAKSKDPVPDSVPAPVDTSRTAAVALDLVQPDDAPADLPVAETKPETPGAPVVPAAPPAGPADDAVAMADAPHSDTSAAPVPPVAPAETAASETPSENPEPIQLTSDLPSPGTEQQPEPKPESVAVLRAGAGGVELLQPAQPEAPDAATGVALGTISYSEQGEVVLNGRAPEGSVIRIYLDNVQIADLGATPDGRWRGELGGVEPGVYTLRLDELDGTGKVRSRVETPFQRAAPEVLKPPGNETLADTPLIRAVTVQAGDTLWAISRERYGDGVLYVRVFEANRDHIRNPDLIYPGQVFNIPE